MLRRHRAPTARIRATRRLLRLTCAATVLLLIPTAASAVIEDYAPYRPQTNCSPNAKPGTLMLSRWLAKRYPGSGSLGISRSCQDGGVSEHKEGRAFDWAVHVGSARDRAYVTAFLRHIFATDADGNTHAVARRMGIMYLIWNDHIYSSYRGFVARDYRGCKVLKGCSATLRHRNHVHISLSRRGGAGLTSWYTGSTTPPPTPGPTPAPTPPSPSEGVLDLSRQPYAAVTVRADGRRTVTPFTLARGRTYKITASGLYGYGGPTQVADASCRWSRTSARWTAYPSRAVAAQHGSLNLMVDGRPISASSCHPKSHVYTRTIRPTRTRALSLRADNRPAGASGTLTVLVSRPATDVTAGLARYARLRAAPTTSEARRGDRLNQETVEVPASGGVVWSDRRLERGEHYRVSVTGTVRLGPGVASDGRCLALGDVWRPRVSLDRRFPDAHHGKLFVDGVPFTGAARSGPACASRTHVLSYTATRTGRLELALWDPLTERDNSGSLTVSLQRL